MTDRFRYPEAKEGERPVGANLEQPSIDGKWEELKEYINRQHQQALKLKDGSPAQRLLIGFWKAIKDKMWNIEKNDHR